MKEFLNWLKKGSERASALARVSLGEWSVGLGREFTAWAINKECGNVLGCLRRALECLRGD